MIPKILHINNLRHAIKVQIRNKFIVLNYYIRKQERKKINDPTIQLRK
jgi:hypothetical protein